MNAADWIKKNTSELCILSKKCKFVSDLKKLVLMECNSIAGCLGRDKQYEHIFLHKNAFDVLKDDPFNAEEIACGKVPLHKILGNYFLRTNSLICRDSYEKFSDLIFDVGLVSLS